MTALFAMACSEKSAKPEAVAKVEAVAKAEVVTKEEVVTKVETVAADAAQRSLKSFDRVVLLGAIDLVIAQGDAAPLRIEASEVDLPKIATEVQGTTLTIACREKNKKITQCGPTQVFVVLPNLKSLEVQGSGKVKGTTGFRTDTLKVGVQGSGGAEFKLYAQKIELNIQGSGNANFSGMVDALYTTIQGSGSLLGYALEVKDANIEIQGSGNAQLHVTDTLKANIMGSGEVVYKGAAEVSKSVRGSGSVRRIAAQ